jgi:uncharacterized membrane protein
MLTWLKVVHIVAGMLFVGNVIVTGIWAEVLFRQRAQVDFAVTARAIVLTDWIFTLGGATALVVSGVWGARLRGFPLWDTRWIRWAMLGLGVSTVIWLVILVPAQRQMVRLHSSDDDAVRSVYGRWRTAGWLAVAPLLWSIWCMVAKPS